MKKRTAALCLLLVCAALFASCGGAIELSYENGAYRNEKSGAAYAVTLHAECEEQIGMTVALAE